MSSFPYPCLLRPCLFSHPPIDPLHPSPRRLPRQDRLSQVRLRGYDALLIVGVSTADGRAPVTSDWRWMGDVDAGVLLHRWPSGPLRGDDADERTGIRERVRRRSPRSVDGGAGRRLRRCRTRVACGEFAFGQCAVHAYMTSRILNTSSKPL
jgi:hypothetical protein